MASTIEHAEIVLSAIIPNRSDLLEKALARLTADHFVDENHRLLFNILERYYQSTAQVIPAQYLDDLLESRVDAARKALFTEMYTLFASREIPDPEFSWSVDQLREHAAHRDTGASLTQAMTILRNGLIQPNGDTLKGADAAREYLMSSLSDIDKNLRIQAAPEGDVRDEMDDLLSEYADRKQAFREGRTGGIRFGIPELDARIGGMQRGELILLAGYSSDGKTSLAVQAAWSAAVEQGKNVVFLTTETLRPQVRRKLVARHSKLPMFGIPEGLNTRDLKAGTLPDSQEAKYEEVVRDLSTNPTYGHLYVAQVPRGSTITSIEQTLYRIQRRFPIDFVVMDYLALLKSDNKRATTREELAAIMKEAKQVSTTFNDGEGVPFLSPWQVSRLARENAEKLGMYSSASLSETAEATNSADLIVSVLAPTDNTNRHAEVTMQILKARDAETANGIVVEVDYATSQFRGRPVSGAALGSPSSGGLGTLI